MTQNQDHSTHHVSLTFYHEVTTKFYYVFLMVHIYTSRLGKHDICGNRMLNYNFTRTCPHTSYQTGRKLVSQYQADINFVSKFLHANWLSFIVNENFDNKMKIMTHVVQAHLDQWDKFFQTQFCMTGSIIKFTKYT